MGKNYCLVKFGMGEKRKKASGERQLKTKRIREGSGDTKRILMTWRESATCIAKRGRGLKANNINEKK